MKNYVIYGDTNFAEEILNVIKIEGRDKVLAFTNDRAFMTRIKIEYYPVISFDELKQTLKEPFEILIAYGYTKMNTLREKVYDECKAAGMKVGSYISTNAICYSERIGEGSMVWPNVYIGPGVVIGICNIIKASCEVAHNNVIGNFNYIAGSVVMGGRASISNHCFIGLNSTIKSGIVLADYTLLGMGCNMLKESEPYGVYVGNPAKMQMKRSLEVSI